MHPSRFSGSQVARSLVASTPECGRAQELPHDRRHRSAPFLDRRPAAGRPSVGLVDALFRTSGSTELARGRSNCRMRQDCAPALCNVYRSVFVVWGGLGPSH
eukprot:2698928-Alexandrium_andersonii.AAC.1